MAAEAVLVHDIAPPHPRYTQLTQMAAEVARRTQGMLTIAINPGGKVLYPGQASLDAVRFSQGADQDHSLTVSAVPQTFFGAH